MYENERNNNSLIYEPLAENLLWEGTGTEGNPFLVSSIEDFNRMKENLSAFYRLSSDIDFKGAALTPTGKLNAAFTGGFDGDGHKIKNFKITGSDFTGLFGVIHSAKLKNLGLENGDVTSTGSYTGILVGCMEGGSITGCYANGVVKGGKYTGGLVGYAISNAVIKDSYARGSVTGGISSGGLAGFISLASIGNCYAACCIETGGYGLADVLGGTIVTGSYYDSKTAGFVNENIYNNGKLTAGMMRKSLYAGWDFVNMWDITEGESYPYHRKTGKPAGTVDPGAVSTGAGTEADPYLIKDAEGLGYLKYELKAYYRLSSDIDLEGAALAPTGTFYAPFTGGFDGDGHKIKNFKITGGDYTGLFGLIHSAKLKNLGLENGEVTSTGSYTGSLAGYMQGGNITGCYANGAVKGGNYTGGLVGYAISNAVIKDSYARGSVTGSSSRGGLAGYTSSVIIGNCYAACRIEIEEWAYGLVNVDRSTTVTGSYYDSKVAGFVSDNIYNNGKLTAGMMRKGLYAGWDFVNMWDITEGESYPYHRKTGKPEGTVDPGAVSAGAGTEADPYLIQDAEGLGYFKYELKGYYRLSSDIDFKGAALAPTGTGSAPFTGGFDGDGHSMKNFKITGNGLFGCARSAKFRNIKMENGEVTSTGSGTGILAGYLNDCNAENICLINMTVNGNQSTGALVGNLYGGFLKRCCVKGNNSVTGLNYVGGLVGEVNGTSATIKECCAIGGISGDRFVGGLLGGTIAGTIVSDSFAAGSVISTTKQVSVGGLVGNTYSTGIKNSYAANSVSTGGSGLAYGSAKVENSYFDSALAGIALPAAYARTTEQMSDRAVYIGWDWDNIWNYKEDSYPALKNIEIFNQEPFELTCPSRTYSSVLLAWKEISGAKKYSITYHNKTVNSVTPGILINDLVPDTDYEFKVRAEIGEITRIWSKILKIRTRKLLFVEGLHSTEKSQNTITLVWDALEDAVSYEVNYNNNVQPASINSCTITELAPDVPYAIQVKALYEDGNSTTSSCIVEKIYTSSPKTDYAREFIEKCENQIWFIDEIENLLNLQGKSINTLNSREDFAAIYAIGLADRGLSGKIPAAIGELTSLEYLYLGGNHLGGSLPEELNSLNKLIEIDLTGNQFMNQN